MSAFVGRYGPWILVSIYMSMAVAGLIWMIDNNRTKLQHSEQLMAVLLERKEYHIQVSEDNNRLLREIESYIHDKCQCDKAGEAEIVPQEEEGD